VNRNLNPGGDLELQDIDFPILCCHDITLSRGCLIAGLPLILAERVEHHYQSMGWSLFHEIT